MTDIFFYIFTTLMLLSGLGVVLSRNPINSAMSMILCLIGVACMMLMLEAYFLAILQVLVYAGAVMVLFLFIIMLLDVEKLSYSKPNIWAVVGGTLGMMFLLLFLWYTFQEFPAPEASPVLASTSPLAFTTSAKSFGYLLFTKYMLPFQVAGFLLLLAMIGVIIISKRIKTDIE